MELWVTALISIAIGLIAAVLCQFIIVPLMKRRVEATSSNELSKSSLGASTDTVLTTIEASPSMNGTGSNLGTENEQKVQQSIEDSVREDDEDKVNKLFHSLQTLTAMFTSFSHGGNDVRYVYFAYFVSAQFSSCVKISRSRKIFV